MTTTIFQNIYFFVMLATFITCFISSLITAYRAAKEHSEAYAGITVATAIASVLLALTLAGLAGFLSNK